jgi:hypothetical protein
MSPFTPAPALFVSGQLPAVVKSQKPEPVNVTIVVLDVALQSNVTLGEIVALAPDATDHAILLMLSLCEVPSPVDAIKEFAETLTTFDSPVPSDTLVNLTAHCVALSFSVCDVTVSAILFFRYSFCKC